MIRRGLPLCLALMAGPLWAQGSIEVTPLDDIEEPQIGLDVLVAPEMGLNPSDTALDPEIGFVDEQALDAETSFGIEPVLEEEVSETAPGAVLRVLDRVSGGLNDLELKNGQSTGFGRIEIGLGECRYPAENPASDAYAYLTVRNVGDAQEVFAGWMLASSPALSALDHPRYDVWVIRCSSD